MCSIALLTASVSALTADFSAIPTSGNSPLSVKFNDASTGNPTGWAWYFGDENYSAKWKMVTSGVTWPQRDNYLTLSMPDGSILVMGGCMSTTCMNDVWKSIDGGATWSSVNPNCPWKGEVGKTAALLSDGSIIVLGGYSKEVWRSTDEGVSWTRMTDKAPWSIPRRDPGCVGLPDGSIVVMGGGGTGGYNDVWRSTDNGVTWLQISAKAEWPKRGDFATVVIPDGTILILGGEGGGFLNDIWKSIDKGETWTIVTNSAAWSKRSGFLCHILPDNSLLIIGGPNVGVADSQSFWRSTDYGKSWTQIDVSNSWSARIGGGSAVLPDGRIVLIGGKDKSGIKHFDVWSLAAAGSTEQNPTHIYPSAGKYAVTLLVYNADGYNIATKSGYIVATGGSGGSQIPGSSSSSGSSSGSGSSAPAQSTDSLLPLAGVGIIALVVIGGAALYFMKSKTTSSPPSTRTNDAPMSGARTAPAQRSTSAPAKGSHHDVFISYANRDKPVADAICNHLETRQIRCWIAPRDITPGIQYQEAIIDAIDSSYIMVLVFSADSNESPHVLTEVTEAMSNKVTIIPFRVEDVQPSKSMKYLINVPHWLDAVNPPMMDHIRKLEETIRVLMEKRERN